MTREDEMIIESQKCYDDIAFLDGVKWADEHPNLESLWHDASDNPTEDTLILYRTTSGECGVTELVCTSEGVWHLFVKEYEVAEWAYIEDLLPKGGEK